MKAEKIRIIILKRLISLYSARYAQLKPKNVEGNLFTYHLKKILDEGLVKKEKDGTYHLTSEGKLYTDNISYKTYQIRIQPNIVTMLVAQNEKGEYLLRRHSREPYFGKFGLAFGKIHLGESIADAAHRELEEKTGQSEILKHRGDVYILAFKNRELVTHALAHIFSANVKKVKLKRSSRLYWVKVGNLDDKKYIRGFKDIMNLVKKNKKTRFFAELTYNL